MRPLITLSLLLVSSALAASDTSIKSLDIDGIRQVAVFEVEHDFGFPTGTASAVYTLNCQKKSLGIQSYLPEELTGVGSEPQPRKVDAKTTALFKKAKVVQADASQAVIKSEDEATYKIFCKNGLVVNDFSDAARNNMVSSIEGNDVKLHESFLNGSRVTLSVPVADAKVNLVFSDDFKSISKYQSFSFGMSGSLELDLVARRKNSALFMLDATKKTLIPVQYDGKPGKPQHISNVKIPASRILTLYYTTNYNGQSDWLKVTIDLKNYQAWSQMMKKPAGVKILGSN